MGGTLNCLASLDNKINLVGWGGVLSLSHSRGEGGGDTYATAQGKIHRDIESTARACRTGPRLISDVFDSDGASGNTE